jgi:hypothetical protein
MWQRLAVPVISHCTAWDPPRYAAQASSTDLAGLVKATGVVASE